MAEREMEWNLEDSLELLKRMQEILYPFDSNEERKFKTTMKNINWNIIAFKVYSASACELHWIMIEGWILQYKTLKDMLRDAKRWLLKNYEAN